MPKLLDVIKEKGLTHEQVIKLVDEYIIEEPTPESITVGEDDKELIEEVEEVIEEKPKKDDTVPEPELYQVSDEELKKLISDAVEEKLKARRTAPSKGKVIDKTGIQPPTATKTIREIATKDWYEVIV